MKFLCTVWVNGGSSLACRLVEYISACTITGGESGGAVSVNSCGLGELRKQCPRLAGRQLVHFLLFLKQRHFLQFPLLVHEQHVDILLFRRLQKQSRRARAANSNKSCRRHFVHVYHVVCILYSIRIKKGTVVGILRFSSKR